jgi:hypothetical protein
MKYEFLIGAERNYLQNVYSVELLMHVQLNLVMSKSVDLKFWLS